MKKLILILLISIGLQSCNDITDVPNSIYNINVTYIDGITINKNYILPSESKLYVSTYRGSYNLNYDARKQCFCSGHIEAGVLRFEIISKKDYN